MYLHDIDRPVRQTIAPSFWDLAILHLTRQDRRETRKIPIEHSAIPQNTICALTDPHAFCREGKFSEKISVLASFDGDKILFIAEHHNFFHFNCRTGILEIVVASRFANVPFHLTPSLKFSMASIYKNASRAAEDSDLSDSSVSDEEQSSGTVRADTSSDASADEGAQVPTTTRLQQLPTELRNRILMLTSRGVSFR